MKQPEFLTKLITSPAYTNKNSNEFARATKYMNLLYPGKINFDTSGNMIQPKYDMTLEQFQTAQFELDSDFESAKQEAEDEIQTEYGQYFENLGVGFDIDDYVIQSETIAVKVLYPSGNIITRNLIIYDLDIPKITKKTKIWRWHAEKGDNTCDDCASRDGEIYDREDDIPEIPVHPNCRCTITEDVIDPDGNTISSKPFSPKKTTAAPEKAANTSAEKATFEKPVNTKSGYYAVFDGKKFTLYADNKPVISWDATSGHSGFQSPQYQNRKSMGPIPEGIYVARQEELQHITPVGFIAGLIPGKYGEWPGSLYSWGNSRVWLEPSKETNTYGRDRFSIHGGWIPGSAGCIDLTSHMNNFVALFDFIGKDLIVNVQY